MRDAVDEILDQWRAVRPDVDPSPIGVVGRLSRAARLVERRLEQNFADHGIESWMYDVLATLRRSGPPYEAFAGELVEQTMVTTGAITHRVDRLVQLGYVERAATADRRKVVVRLTESGRALVDDVVVGHLAVESELLAALGSRRQTELATTLRTLLVSLGDTRSSA